MDLSDRLKAIEKATKKLTPPEKLVLQIIQLFIIVPIFVLILRIAQDWTSLLWAAGFIALYPLVLTPVKLSLIRKYF